MYWTTESRVFLSATHEAGGTATMRDIRHRTNLTEGQRQHQFRKLETAGFIEVDRKRELTANNTKMKIAVLTEAGINEIQRGVLNGDTDYSRRTSIDVAELADDVEEIQTYISEYIHPKFREFTKLKQSVEAVEDSS